MHRTFSSKTGKVVYYSSSWHEHILNNTNSFIGETFTNSLILGLVVSLSLSIFYSFLQKFRIVKVILVTWYLLQPYLWRRWNLSPIREKLSHMDSRIKKSNFFCRRIIWLVSSFNIVCNIYLVSVDHNIWFWFTRSNLLVLSRFSYSV